MGSLLLWKDLISGFPTAGKCLKQRGSSDKGFVVGVEFNLLSEEGPIPHCYKRPGKRRRSRRAGRHSLDCTCLPKMEQNGTKENGRSEETPACGPPRPVQVQDIRFTKVNGRRVTCCRPLYTSKLFHFHRSSSTINGSSPAGGGLSQLSTQQQVANSVRWKKRTRSEGFNECRGFTPSATSAGSSAHNLWKLLPFLRFALGTT